MAHLNYIWQHPRIPTFEMFRSWQNQSIWEGEKILLFWRSDWIFIITIQYSVVIQDIIEWDTNIVILLIKHSGSHIDSNGRQQHIVLHQHVFDFTWYQTETCSVPFTRLNWFFTGKQVLLYSELTLCKPATRSELPPVFVCIFLWSVHQGHYYCGISSFLLMLLCS